MLEPGDARARASREELLPAPHLDARLVEASVRGVSALTVDDYLLQDFGKLAPGADLAGADAGLIEQALAVQHQVTEEKQRRDVLLALVCARVPPRLRQVVAVLLGPL